MELETSIVIKAIDRATSPIKRINRAIDGVTRPARRVNKALGDALAVSGFHRVAGAANQVGRRMNDVTASAGRLGVKMAVVGGGIGWLFKTQLLDTAAAFEQFQVVLEQTEGSSEAAKKAMDWVSDFAAQTPYNLDQVMAGFVKLRAYGLEPTNGLLRTLGDTAAGMGKSLNDAVEAISDAVTGENERLKEFGITTRMAGNKVVYQYSINGKEMQKIAKRGNRAMIQSTLEAIWNEKYGGQMKKMMKTWNGMMSLLGDQWMRFKLMIMEAGAFEFLKGKLSNLLKTIDRLAASGELKEMAAAFGENLKIVLEKLWQAGKATAAVMGVLFGALSSVADMLGGWENLGYTIAALFGLKLVVAVGSMILAINALGIALMTTPFGWIIGIVAVLAAAAVLVYKNWEPIVGFFRDMWAAIKSDFLAGINWITDKINAVTGILPDWMTGGPAAEQSTAPTVPHGPVRTVRHSRARKPDGGELHIRIDAEGRPVVKRLVSNNPDFDMNVDTGLVMAAPG